MTMYKLIKEYPGSPDLGKEVAHTWVGQDVSQHPEFWEKVKEKDYKILFYKHRKSGNFRNIAIPSEEYAPFAVKRTIDGEVFKVGDFISTEYGRTATIEGMKEANGLLYVFGMGVGLPTTIMQIRHAVRGPLFTTHDGVDIYKGDIYWILFDSIENIQKETNAVLGCGKRKDALYFSTKEKAEAWADNNELKYSKNDLRRMLDL